MTIPVILGDYKISILVELRDSRGVIKLSPVKLNEKEYYCQCLICDKQKNEEQWKTKKKKKTSGRNF